MMMEGLDRLRVLSEREPFALRMGMQLTALEEGYARVEMTCTPEFGNFFGTVHGGAIFSLIDEAFGAAANSCGMVSVALSVNVSYLRPANTSDRLYAEASEVSRSRRISTYLIQVKDESGKLIANCHAMAFIKGDPLPSPSDG